MTPFVATPDGYEAYWEEAERGVLAAVAREVAAMLRDQTGLPGRVADSPGALAVTVQTTGTARIPDDEAARRLLPDASRDDAEVSAEFRHLTQTDLAAAKVRGLEYFADLLDPAGSWSGAAADEAFEDEDGDRAVLAVGHDDADLVAAALTDVRLVVAQRLGLKTDDDVETLHDEVLADASCQDAAGRMDAEVRRYWGGVFVAAGFAQESLVSAMLNTLRQGHG